MIIGNKEFDLDNKGYIMGILNVTPDSFSDGGKWNDVNKALEHAKEMVNMGATIIDVGGESTRPGYTKISDEEEINRVVPVIKAIKENLSVAVSIDTYKSEVARAALNAGADMVNDIWGLKYDKNMAAVVSEYEVPVCIMHNRDNENYNSFMDDVIADLKESIKIAKEANIKDENIMIDPGVGFAKSLEQNLEITNKLERLGELGYPILLATSRKSMIGLTLNVDKNERVEGTVATTVIGAMKGASIFRVHDVLENKRALDMTMAIKRS
ncbi:dihydropteroate synthase [Lachnospira multipara]|uniref:dihydropteroate synthase n=1 Tax=Lachnospira multipara TaxID=28051 RepID=UPI0004E18E2D|nr:dihydropteroate synthase [Lachnospira multipara]